MSKRVLVIEDDREIAALLELHLRDLGCDVSLAYDGTSGLERALSSPHSLIILDLMLPGVEGLELCRRLRIATQLHTHPDAYRQNIGNGPGARPRDGGRRLSDQAF